MGVTTAATPQHCLEYSGFCHHEGPSSLEQLQSHLLILYHSGSDASFQPSETWALCWDPLWPLPAYFTPGSEAVLGLVVPGPPHSVDLLFYPIPVVTAFRSSVLQVHLPEIWTSHSCDSPRSFPLSLPTCYLISKLTPVTFCFIFSDAVISLRVSGPLYLLCIALA